MATAFAHTMRSLSAESPRGLPLALACMALLLGAWLLWSVLARVTVYAVTPRARLEVAAVGHPLTAPVTGQVVATHLRVGQAVQAGAVLIELDTEAQRLQDEEARARLAALTAQWQATRQEMQAEEEAWQAEQQAARMVIEEARARLHEAAVGVQSAHQEAEVVVLLPGREFAGQLDLMRSKAEVVKRQAAVETLHLTVERLTAEQRVRERERQARLARLQRDYARFEGERATTLATLARLAHDIAQRQIRAPIAGHLGEAAPLPLGTMVREGSVLGTVLPPGELRVVAAFPPSLALGRLRPGQVARLRLDGFPWTQYGSLATSVSSVAQEGRDGQLRVELRLTPAIAVPFPLQHGLTGTLEVALEQVSPATLLVRGLGQHLGLARVAPAAGDGPQEQP